MSGGRQAKPAWCKAGWKTCPQPCSAVSTPGSQFRCNYCFLAIFSVNVGAAQQQQLMSMPSGNGRLAVRALMEGNDNGCHLPQTQNERDGLHSSHPLDVQHSDDMHACLLSAPVGSACGRSSCCCFKPQARIFAVYSILTVPKDAYCQHSNALCGNRETTVDAGNLAQSAASGESAPQASGSALVHASREDIADACGGYPGCLCSHL